MRRDSNWPHLAGAAAVGPGVRHQAMIGRDSADCVDAVLAFVEDGLRHGEAVSVGLSAALGRRLGRVLGSQRLVAYFDMTELGRNPGRIIAAMLDFARTHAGGALAVRDQAGPPLRYVSEPFWAGRSDAERAEAARHEALVEPALAGAPATVLCVYNSSRLDAETIECAERMHPVVIEGGEPRASAEYIGRGIVPPHCDRPLGPVPPGATRLGYRDDLRAVRDTVAGCAAEAGLAPGRTTDLVLAVSEVAANTLRHTQAPGTLHVWQADGEIICQVTDSGRIADPLVGRRRPPADSFRHGGLWVVNQVCDLVELRSGPDGTTVRMHVRL
ncbi:MAG TPA: sensor histidine kinase [Streptosporangiaceae bacterium]|nr:sensor histidine kinase [Streptosporangiaceae bacterium]